MPCAIVKNHFIAWACVRRSDCIYLNAIQHICFSRLLECHNVTSSNRREKNVCIRLRDHLLRYVSQRSSYVFISYIWAEVSKKSARKKTRRMKKEHTSEEREKNIFTHGLQAKPMNGSRSFIRTILRNTTQKRIALYYKNRLEFFFFF